MTHFHHAACGCLQAPSPTGFSRRGALRLGAGAAIGGAVLAAFPALAADGQYEAMLLNCIDPRFTTSSWAYMAGQGYKDLYSHFVIAGGPIGIIAPNFKEWQLTFWENLAISLRLHGIKRVVGLTHRDCGAAAVVYGERAKTDKGFETTSHVTALRQFRAEVAKRHPKMAVHTGIMALDGSVEAVS
jgi:carbonic anhydrase